MNEPKDLFDVIEWYRKLPRGYGNVEELAFMKTRLAGFYVDKAEEYSAQNLLYNETHSKRRLAEAKKIIYNLSDVDPTTEKFTTLGKSQAKALVSVEDDYLSLYSLKGNVEGLQEILRVCREILWCIKQDISRLKGVGDDAELTEADNGSNENNRHNI